MTPELSASCHSVIKDRVRAIALCAAFFLQAPDGMFQRSLYDHQTAEDWLYGQYKCRCQSWTEPNIENAHGTAVWPTCNMLHINITKQNRPGMRV